MPFIKVMALSNTIARCMKHSGKSVFCHFEWYKNEYLGVYVTSVLCDPYIAIT